MKPGKALYCVLHQQGEFPYLQYHHKLFGFSFSQHTCPRETQLVVSLFKASLSSQFGYLQLRPVAAKSVVSILYHKTHDENLHCTFSKVDEIEKNWGIDLARDESLILSLQTLGMVPTRVWKTLITRLLSYLICLGAS